MVDTLEYLQRGGRIGGAAALLGTLLKIRPILQVAAGRLEPLDRVRTRPKALARMLDLMASEVHPGMPVWAAVAHGGCADEAAEVMAQLRTHFDCRRLFMAEVGPTISTHSGPGVLTIATCPVP